MAPIRFSWLANLGAMIDERSAIQVSCTKCGIYHRFTTEELAALADKVGRNFSLWNRRCRCRLTPNCLGWNRFNYLLGVYRPLWDQAGTHHWQLDPIDPTPPQPPP